MSDVLIVEDDAVLREALVETMSLAGHSYLEAKNGKEALELLAHHRPAVILSDVRMDKLDGRQLLSEIQRRNPGVPVILMTAYGTIEEAVKVMQYGAADYLQKPFSTSVLTEKINRFIKLPFSEDGEPIAHDPKSQELLAMALRVAQTDVGVMISGESGTGKEVLAHFIHDHSPRKDSPFIAINCAAIPEHMLEATLFGYEKGAFTGAYKSTSGKFEQAQGGTLLLDEVSEMSLSLQAKLLRVLQEKEVERIGANKLIRLDVRVIATSNRQLVEEVKLGRFREDLYYRLNVFPLYWLPLRDRRRDIIPLANYLLHRNCVHSKIIIPSISEEAVNVLLNYSWPGNARELNNVIQRALVLQAHGVIEPHHLHLTSPYPQQSTTPDSKDMTHLQRHEYDVIEQTLKQNSSDRQKTATVLGISERTLRYKLAKMREEGYTV